MYHFNGEYTILATLSVIIYTLMFFSFLYGDYVKSLDTSYIIIYIVCSFVWLMLGVAGCLYIHKCSTMKNAMMKNTVYYFDQHLEYAKKIGFLTEEEYKKAKKFLVPLPEEQNNTK